MLLATALVHHLAIANSVRLPHLAGESVVDGHANARGLKEVLDNAEAQPVMTDSPLLSVVMPQREAALGACIEKIQRAFAEVPVAS